MPARRQLPVQQAVAAAEPPAVPEPRPSAAPRTIVDRTVLNVAALQESEIDADVIARATGLPRIQVLTQLASSECLDGTIRSVGETIRFADFQALEIARAAIDDIQRKRLQADLDRARAEAEAEAADSAD